MAKLTKNDKAWERLFQKYNILESINENGFYEIESRTINQFRESRLMTKFDHYVNLPKIFKDNNLTVLSISRYKYIIGQFENYKEVDYEKSIKTKSVSFPSYIESIDYHNLYSESSALHCAYLTGIIDELMEEKTYLTVSGRMTTDNFSFNIRNVNTGSLHSINVNKAQIEVDAAFESSNAFMIIEAKNFEVEDLLIRQLYYPYRLWSRKINKKIIPVFMTYSNDIFSFFIYDFEVPLEYNSLKLIKQKKFVIYSDQIELDDIRNIFKQIKIIKEPKVPFPQADKFERVVDLLGLLVNNDLTKEDITQNYEFTVRQTDYYTNAGIYLGLIKKYTTINDRGDTEIVYTLTDYGINVMNKTYKEKYLSLVESILKHEVFYKVLKKFFQSSKLPDKDEIIKIMMKSYLYNVNNLSTIGRRTQTVLKWVSWIINLTKN